MGDHAGDRCLAGHDVGQMDSLEVSRIFDRFSSDRPNFFSLENYKGIQQTKQMRINFPLIVILLFFLLSALFYGLNMYDPVFKFGVLMTGNMVMAILSLLTFGMVKKTMKARPEAFVRGVYGATFLKLMVCMSAILIYVLLDRKNIHKPSLFILFGIYAVYTAVETVLLGKLAKQAK